MKTPVGNRGEELRELSRCPSGVNALERSWFGEVETRHAERMHRRKAFAQVEPTLVRFGDVGKEKSGDFAASRGVLVQAAQNLRIGETTQTVNAHRKPLAGARLGGDVHIFH